jgi:hypothetical protein
MTYERVVIALRLYLSEQCLNPVFLTSIKTHNFVTFYKFLIHVGMHNTNDGCVAPERRCPCLRMRRLRHDDDWCYSLPHVDVAGIRRAL